MQAEETAVCLLAWRLSRTVVALFYPSVFQAVHLQILDYAHTRLQDGQRRISVDDELCKDTRICKDDAERGVTALASHGLLTKHLTRKKPVKGVDRLHATSAAGKQREFARKTAPDSVTISIDPRTIHDIVRCREMQMRERLQCSHEQLRCNACGHLTDMSEELLRRVVDKATGNATCVRCAKGQYQSGASGNLAEFNTVMRPVSLLLTELNTKLQEWESRRKEEEEEKKKKKEERKTEPVAALAGPSVKPARSSQQRYDALRDIEKATGLALHGDTLAKELEAEMELDAQEQERQRRRDEEARTAQIMEELKSKEEKMTEFDDAPPATAPIMFSVQGVMRDLSWCTEEEQQRLIEEMTDEERAVYEKACTMQQ
jgi:hypothetical protein